jgi:hypothetical protein
MRPPRADYPVCVPCRQDRDATFDGATRPRALPRADAYVRVRGTTGLYRHVCRACLAQTGDTLISWLPPPRPDAASSARGEAR